MSKQQLMRLKRTVLVTVLFAAAAVFYLLVISKYIGIPCIFNKITGLKCPGCGITRSLIALLHLDLGRAVSLNIFSFAIITYIAAVYFHSAFQYVKTGKHRVAFPVEWINIAFLILLIAWFIFRNILGL